MMVADFTDISQRYCLLDQLTLVLCEHAIVIALGLVERLSLWIEGALSQYIELFWPCSKLTLN